MFKGGFFFEVGGRALCVGIASVATALVLQSVGAIADKTDAPAIPARHAITQEFSSLRKPGETFWECLTCPHMVVLPAGKFRMGASSGSFQRGVDTDSAHDVTIPKSFAIGKFDVTRSQYATFVHETGRPNAAHCYVWSTRINNWMDGGAGRDWQHPGFEQTDDDPVVCVNSYDAKAYIQWLNAKVGGSQDRPYRLPSEEEWEYAARAGTTTKYYWGNSPSRDMANFGSEKSHPFTPAASGHDRWLYTSPVGSFKPNAFGLYDMAGNVVQLTGSCMNSARYSDYSTGSCKSGFLLNNENSEMTKGGSWLDIPDYLGVSARTWVDQSASDSVMGFRVARDLN